MRDPAQNLLMAYDADRVGEGPMQTHTTYGDGLPSGFDGGGGADGGAVGGGGPKVVVLPGSERRTLLVVPKVGPTPERFPRRPGAARKRPLA